MRIDSKLFLQPRQSLQIRIVFLPGSRSHSKIIRAGVLEVGTFGSTEDLKDVVLVIDGVTGVLGSRTNSFLLYTGEKPRVTAQKLTIMVSLN